MYAMIQRRLVDVIKKCIKQIYYIHLVFSCCVANIVITVLMRCNFVSFIVFKNVHYQAKSQKHIPTPGGIWRQCFSESSMSGKYFGRLIATGEWGVRLVSSCKVRYTQYEIKQCLFFKG